MNCSYVPRTTAFLATLLVSIGVSAQTPGSAPAAKPISTTSTLAPPGIPATQPKANLALTTLPAAEMPEYASFDSYRVLAITGGAISGAVIAGILSDGLILPIYFLATGVPVTNATGMGVGVGVGFTSGMYSSAMQVWSLEAWVLRSTLQILGAVGGGFYADHWYYASDN